MGSPSFATLLEAATQISQGAEAKVYKANLTLDGPSILVKHRFQKNYRHPTLDNTLTRSRVAGEARALLKCLRSGVHVPGLRMVDAAAGALGLEWIEGKSVRRLLPGGADDEGVEPLEDHSDSNEEPLKEYGVDTEQLMQLIGTELAKMHAADIIHGDLTTSNMMLRHPSSFSSPDTNNSTQLVLIDFGLSYISTLVEDKAVDLYVLERAFASTHPESEPLFASVLTAYAKKMGKDWNSISRRLDDVRLRGRKRSMPMETQDYHFQRPKTPKSSISSSGIDLSGSPAGILASAPSSPSPSLDPSDSRRSFARRRTSWSKRLTEADQDPLRFDTFENSQHSTPLASSALSSGLSSGSKYSPSPSEDPFSGADDRAFSPTAMYRISQASDVIHDYPPPLAGSSRSTFRIASEDEREDGHREDDEAHLTSNMSKNAGEDEYDSSDDPEHTAAMPPRSRRKSTLRYSAPASPLKKTGSALKSMSHNLRRASVRVVNLASAGLENQIQLGDGTEDVPRVAKPDEEAEEPMHDLKKILPIRGRTLGCLGPESELRLNLFNFLVNPWTEPTILVLIIVNAIVLSIQAASPLTLSTSDGSVLPPRVRGYFHSWEDWVLFVLFVIFTLEAFARICVSGFLLDPDIPFSSIFRSPFSSSNNAFPPTPTHSSMGSLDRVGSLSQGNLGRGGTITQKIRRFRSNLRRPFELRARPPRSPYPNTVPGSQVTLTAGLQEEPVNPLTEKLRNAAKGIHDTVRSPPQATYMSEVMRSDTKDSLALPFRLNITHIHDKAHRNVPYLRQSWTRIDFIAILSFWITFFLAMFGEERGRYHIGVFRALSVLRTARLLTITSGTTTIMHSLKTARPLLTQVAYFVLFAMVLFSIIGIQSFKGSLRRTCVLSPTLGVDEIELEQTCGGYIDPGSFNPIGYIQLDGDHSSSTKGYICPLGQVCKEHDNPSNGVENFDTIWYSTLQVVIVATANGWTPVMYSMIDAEFFVSCFFFIIAVIVLNFWLINLFVAVITNTFSAIRSQTKKSAFGAAPLVAISDDQDETWTAAESRKNRRTNIAREICRYTHWFWVLLALISLGLQASRTVDMEETHEAVLFWGELIITLAFDVEIILRVLASLPEWRSFFWHGNNVLDLVLAIGSSVIQIPFIRNSAVYPWFTIFQLARFYRVILVVPRMKPLLLAVFGNMYGLANMSLFLILINYISALISVQLLRGDVGEDAAMNFGELWNAFLGVYKVFSSENWTDVLYTATGAEARLGQTVIVAVFIASWMLFANFIVLQMFIAVINENFEVAEEAKKGEQASKYWASRQAARGSPAWLRRFNPYRWVKANPVRVKVDALPANLILPMQKSIVQDNNMLRTGARASMPSSEAPGRSMPRHYSSKSLNALERLFAGSSDPYDVPLATLRHHREGTMPNDEVNRHLELLASVNPEGPVEDINDILAERRAQKADFIRNHPSYDKTFWIFSQKNILRRMCQKLVQPANGERIFGEPYSPIAHPIFQLLLLLTVIGGIVVESIATPTYRREYFQRYGSQQGAWFDVAETVFGFALVVEFLIKIIADGFAFTPNAYVRSKWNIMDFGIMVGILVNVITGLIFIGGLSRFTRSLKALRALRLITLIDQMRYTFQSLILSGALRILDAAVLAILYMIPYAVWGLNIFNGKMKTCNDSDVAGIAECTGAYVNNVVGDSFGFPVPRVWDSPSPSTTFSFDTFRSSLLILFEIVSLEGWTDVMEFANGIAGIGLQPENNIAEYNALFFVIYNLLGAVVILTLFVSIIIGNFSSKTGSAFLTQPQREWIDLKKLFQRQKPSKRPKRRPTNPIRAWCFDRAVQKHGWWSRAMTFLFVLHILALMTQTFASNALADEFRNEFFLALMFIYILDVVVRLFGLGWNSYRANGWNLFDIVVAGGSFVTTLVVRFGNPGFATQQLQKLFLVSIAFKLVQRTNSLNMLFKTAVSSLPVILSLLGLWLILFVFFSIMYVEVFGLTKWGSGENRNQNYTSVGSALVMLAFMSVGEGWNQFMHDYAISYPRCTNTSPTEPESDCGSESWAFGLAITWNLLSMYIFVNMFTGVVVENFSYVFQTSTGGVKTITREEMRAFKKVWAQFANPKTGYLERERFVPFFAKLSGVFEARIYPAEYSIPNILAAAKESSDPTMNWSSKMVDGVDLAKLNAILDGIDYTKIRKRRAIYSRLYHEASISHQRRGMSFNDMLMLLAHHKLIVDGDALVLKDLVVRTETNKLVTDLVNLDRVRSLLKSITCRRRFLAYKERMLYEQQKGIPSIIVDAESEAASSPGTTPDGSPRLSGMGSPGFDHRFRTPDVSLALDSAANLHRSSHGRRISDLSMLSSSDYGSSSRRTSFAVEADPQNVLSSMQSSPWGNLMLEAAHEDERF